MDYYASVTIGPKEADKQKNLLMALNDIGIISISKEEIEEDYENMKENPRSVHNQIVLHGEKEVNEFKDIMKQQFNKKSYRITSELQDPAFTNSFRKWLEQKSRTKNTPLDEKGGARENEQSDISGDR